MRVAVIHAFCALAVVALHGRVMRLSAKPPYIAGMQSSSYVEKFSNLPSEAATQTISQDARDCWQHKADLPECQKPAPVEITLLS